MRVANLNKDGIRPAVTRSVYPGEGGKSPYYCVAHGMPGQRSWEYRLPLFSQHFPHDENVKSFDLDQDNYTLFINNDKRDPQGNPRIIINKGESDKRYLILLDMEPYEAGVAYYDVSGNAQVLARGLELSEGCATPTEKPVILVEGPCKVVWVRDGVAKDHDYRGWDAVYDGSAWSIMPHFEDWQALLRRLSHKQHALAG